MEQPWDIDSSCDSSEKFRSTLCNLEHCNIYIDRVLMIKEKQHKRIYLLDLYLDLRIIIINIFIDYVFFVFKIINFIN